MSERPVLHMLCGKAAAGKSTLAARLAATPQTLLVTHDRWMATLYPDELVTEADNLRYGPRLRAAMEPHLVDLLRAGVSLVLDWPANTLAVRDWLRAVAAQGRAGWALHWLDSPDALCLHRLARRDRVSFTPARFASFGGSFEPPTAAECCDLTCYPPP